MVGAPASMSRKSGWASWSSPPELLLARQREQLAGQLKLAFIQEQTAQEQRQKTEQARATANQQSDLVTAQIGVQTATLLQDKRAAEGRAEKLFSRNKPPARRRRPMCSGRIASCVSSR